MPYIHSPVRLAHLSGISDEMSEEQLSLLDVLAPLWKLGREISHDIEPVLLSDDDMDSGFLQTVQHTGIAV